MNKLTFAGLGFVAALATANVGYGSTKEVLPPGEITKTEGAPKLLSTPGNLGDVVVDGVEFKATYDYKTGFCTVNFSMNQESLDEDWHSKGTSYHDEKDNGSCTEELVERLYKEGKEGLDKFVRGYKLERVLRPLKSLLEMKVPQESVTDRNAYSSVMSNGSCSVGLHHYTEGDTCVLALVDLPAIGETWMLGFYDDGCDGKVNKLDYTRTQLVPTDGTTSVPMMSGATFTIVPDPNGVRFMDIDNKVNLSRSELTSTTYSKMDQLYVAIKSVLRQNQNR